MIGAIDELVLELQKINYVIEFKDSDGRDSLDVYSRGGTVRFLGIPVWRRRRRYVGSFELVDYVDESGAGSYIVLTTDVEERADLTRLAQRISYRRRLTVKVNDMV